MRDQARERIQDSASVALAGLMRRAVIHFFLALHNRFRQSRSLAASIGLVSVIGILAGCFSPPSWSPDGQKILFPVVLKNYIDEDKKYYMGPDGFPCRLPPTPRVSHGGMGVALYDTPTGQTRLLFPTTEDQASFGFLMLRWLKDSRTALVIGSRKEKKCDDPKTFETIMLIDTESGEITKRYVTEGSKFKEEMAAFAPVLIQDRYLFASDGESLVRLDLGNGQYKHRAFNGDTIVPLQWGDSVYYFKDDGGEGIDYGTVDADDLELNSLGYTSSKTLGNFSAGMKMELKNAAISPDGSRLALNATIDKRVRAMGVFEGDEIRFLSKASACQDDAFFTNLAWSPDGKKVYAGTVSRTQGTERGLRFGVCAFELEQETACYIALFELDIGATEFFWPRYQVSTSPDGDRLAVGSTMLDALDPGDEHRALYILNARQLDDEPIVVRPPYAQQSMSAENLAARCDFYQSRRTYFEEYLAEGFLFFGKAWADENIAWLETMQEKHCGTE